MGGFFLKDLNAEQKDAEKDYVCSKCPVGEFQAEDYVLHEACQKCPKGEAAANSGEPLTIKIITLPGGGSTDQTPSCKHCSKGQYMNEEGKSRDTYGCKTCITGRHADNEGSYSCKDCVSGKFSADVRLSFLFFFDPFQRRRKCP